LEPFKPPVPYVKFCEEKNTVLVDGEKHKIPADEWELLSACVTQIRAREVAQRLCGRTELFCPYCGSTQIDAEYVDIGVGQQRITPFYCYDCAAAEIASYEVYMSAVELALGWYKPYPRQYEGGYD
jgi:hypothetical protein